MARSDLVLCPSRGGGAAGVPHVRAGSPRGDRRLSSPARAGAGPCASAQGMHRPCLTPDACTRQGDDQGALQCGCIHMVDSRVDEREHLQGGPGTRDLREAGCDSRMACTTMRPLGSQPGPRGIRICSMQVPTPQAGCATGHDQGTDNGLRSQSRNADVRHVQGHGLSIRCGIRM